MPRLLSLSSIYDLHINDVQRPGTGTFRIHHHHVFILFSKYTLIVHHKLEFESVAGGVTSGVWTGAQSVLSFLTRGTITELAEGSSYLL